MRSSFLALAALASSAAAVVLPRDETTSSASTTYTNIPAFSTRKWPLLNPTQALAQLHAKATQDPKAVDFLPGVPLPTNWAQVVSGIEHGIDGIGKGIENGLSKIQHDVAGITEQWIDENVARPEGPAKPTEEQQPKHADTPEATRIKQEAAAKAGTCASIATHYEWNHLTSQHKTELLSSIKCMFGKPPRSGLPGVQNRWDDLVAIHQHMSPIIHNVGQFLPWHRYFMKIFEMELRNTCGYTGPMFWWDESKDAGNFAGSPLGTSQYWGHFPNGNAVCIISGVFANTNEHIGPGNSNINHCLSRGVNEQSAQQVGQSYVNLCNSYNDFEDMNNCVFFGPHAYGHDAMGGVMSDVESSPGDPIFFAHHGYIDHNWRIWQNLNSNNVYALGGYTTQNCGNNCQPTELNYVLSSMGFYPSVTVDQVMNTEGPYLCYRYDY